MQESEGCSWSETQMCPCQGKFNITFSVDSSPEDFALPTQDRSFAVILNIL